jgi:excisionase family DNA binding protein
VNILTKDTPEPSSRCGEDHRRIKAIRRAMIGVGAEVGLSPEEVCAKVGVGKTFFYAEVKRGRLKIRKIGRRTIVLPEDLDRWVRGEVPSAA